MNLIIVPILILFYVWLHGKVESNTRVDDSDDEFEAMYMIDNFVDKDGDHDGDYDTGNNS